MNNDGMKEKWEALHSQGRFRPKYPHELAVQFVFRHFRRNGTERALDLGCGAGRHVVLMGNENIIPYGIDISSEGVAYTKLLLRHIGMGQFCDHIVCGDFTQIPFEDNFFDGILAFGSLYYGDNETVKAAFSEIYRLCAPEGSILLLVRGCEDYRYGQGKEIEKNTFVIDCSDETASAFAERGMKMHFYEADELRCLLHNFSSVQIDSMAVTTQGGGLKNFDYIVTAKK